MLISMRVSNCMHKLKYEAFEQKQCRFKKKLDPQVFQGAFPTLFTLRKEALQLLAVLPQISWSIHNNWSPSALGGRMDSKSRICFCATLVCLV